MDAHSHEAKLTETGVGQAFDPFSNPPADLDLRVQRYVQTASRLKISPTLVAKYARILIAAEEVVAARAQDIKETEDEMARVAAAEHGIKEDDPRKAQQAYASARWGQQQIHNSAVGFAKRAADFGTKLTKRYQSLPVIVKYQFPLEDILNATGLIKRFAEATKPHPYNLSKVTFAVSELSLTKEAHALFWWRTEFNPGRGQWKDTYALARCWHLTDSKHVADFRRVVRKLNPSADRRWLMGCPPWARP